MGTFTKNILDCVSNNTVDCVCNNTLATSHERGSASFFAQKELIKENVSTKNVLSKNATWRLMHESEKALTVMQLDGLFSLWKNLVSALSNRNWKQAL